jgi:hypothetical protein
MKQGEKPRTGWLGTLLGGLGILALCFILFIFIVLPLLVPLSGTTQQPTPTSSPTPLSTATPLTSFEIAGDTEVARTDKLVEIDIDYPVRMSPRSSNSVRVSIYIPARLALIWR